MLENSLSSFFKSEEIDDIAAPLFVAHMVLRFCERLSGTVSDEELKQGLSIAESLVEARTIPFLAELGHAPNPNLCTQNIGENAHGD